MVKSGVDNLVVDRSCPLCGGVEAAEVNRYRDFQFFSDGTPDAPKRVDVATVRCHACSCLYMNPVYTQSGFRRLFAEAGQSYGSSAGRQDEVVDWISDRVDLSSDGSVCDIGCYDGGLLSRLPHGVGRIGVDIDQPAIERARSSDPGGTYVLGDLHDFRVPHPPTVYTMFHVLEHVERPPELLRNLLGQSNERTRLVIEVPILELVKTQDVCGFFSVQHLTHFTRRTLRQAVESAGWTIVEWQEQESYNGCRILCRPGAGGATASPVSAGQIQDVELLHRVLWDWNGHLSKHAASLLALQSAEHVIIWGAGMHTETLQAHFSLLSALDVKKWSLIDSDPMKIGTSWRGIPVGGPEALRGVNWSETLMLVSTYGGQEEVARLAREAGVPDAALVELYDAFRLY